jgi:hypothetical protein
MGLASGVVSVIDGVPYVRDIRRGATRPHRGTWSIWGALAIVAFGAQIADGGAWSLVMLGTQAVTISAIWLLSLRHGEGGLSRTDVVLLCLAACGVAGWVLSSSPLVATLCVVIADSVGVAMMLPKSWRDPHSETVITFSLAALAGALSAVAVGEIDASLLIYPIYFACANATVASVIWIRRRSTVIMPI